MAMFEGVQKVFSYKAIACCSKLLFTKEYWRFYGRIN
jgi:hypothetical protein